MIPGLGAAVRVGKGFRQRKQFESRIQELEILWTTPAASHYEGVKRFEVATVLCDAELGRIFESDVEPDIRAKAAREYLNVLEMEYVMVLEQASSTPASKAEVYALGLALKEVALSFDETSADFKATCDEQLAVLGVEIEGMRLATANVSRNSIAPRRQRSTRPMRPRAMHCRR